MKLPGIEFATIDERKIRDYLLAATHPAGRSKARFFGYHGFRRESAFRLRHALLEHAAGHDIKRSQSTGFGTKYLIEGPLATPSGQAVWIRAVWFLGWEETVPRFVTAYPLREKCR